MKVMEVLTGRVSHGPIAFYMITNFWVYSGVFGFGLSLYGLFWWLIGPYKNKNAKFLLHRFYRSFITRHKSNKVNVIVIGNNDVQTM